MSRKWRRSDKVSISNDFRAYTALLVEHAVGFLAREIQIKVSQTLTFIKLKLQLLCLWRAELRCSPRTNMLPCGVC
jgi:hypothetical protein